MAKYSPFRYIKPGPGILNHLAQAHGPGTKSLGTIVYRERTYVLPSALPRLLGLDGFAWAAVRGPTVGGYCA